jgi:CBS domain-containing protein
MSRVRDAMIVDPHALEASASAQQAGQLFDRPEVRAVLVCEDGRLTGVITRKTLVREVVARGRDPQTTPLRDVAEPPVFTVDAEDDLEHAYRELEERDLERVPVVEAGKLVGVLSRAVVQRRLAEDEPPLEPEAGV